MEKKISILIVDDEDSVRDSLNLWFTEDGYRVECAENAKKALSILESGSFDIILTDLKMPGMDGLELLRRIRALNKESIIIVMTAFASVDTAVKALKDGAFDYVTKPFDPDDLSHLIRNATKQISLTHENETLKKRVDSLENVEDLIGKLTSSKWAKIAKCSKDTAIRDINDLIDKNILQKEAEGGRSTNYELK
jgi:DNA-binding NtrC family response regulator